jgi:gamma-carbonic anhydrase
VIASLGGLAPRIAPGAYVAPTAVLIGDVEVGEEASIWFGCVLRGDTNRIRIGARSNLQDGTIVHVNPGEESCTVGEDVTVGHGAILHGCRLEDGAFVGMGAIVLDRCVIERGGVLGAGALLPAGRRIGAGELWLGRPARLVRTLDDAERQHFAGNARRYVETGRRFARELAVTG